MSPFSRVRFGYLPDFKFTGWQVVWCFGIIRSEQKRVLPLGWRTWMFGIFKVVSTPAAGADVAPENIRGFLWQLQVWLPWDGFGRL